MFALVCLIYAENGSSNVIISIFDCQWEGFGFMHTAKDYYKNRVFCFVFTSSLNTNQDFCKHFFF